MFALLLVAGLIVATASFTKMTVMDVVVQVVKNVVGILKQTFSLFQNLRLK